VTLGLSAYFCFVNTQEIYMRRCIELAQNGLGLSRPNPSVGCVIVWRDQLIGEGCTSAYGGAHAEVNAINAVTDKSLLSQATLYVTLEPCSHFGKTPPCADLIVKYAIPKVVIGCLDTNVLVAGKGIHRLTASGCDVVVGVLERECREQHRRFFTFQNLQRPYVVLKWAETFDGFIAPTSKDGRRPFWISNAESQQLVHKWRGEEQAILVGTQTVLADNPKLTLRTWSGNNPLRIVLDRSLRIPKSFEVLNDLIPTWVLVDVACKQIPEDQKHIRYIKIDFSQELASQICEVLFRLEVQSVIIEGGRQTLQTFVDAGLWDEARVFVGAQTFGSGVEAPELGAIVFEQHQIKDTQLHMYRNTRYQV
jgi:diaminohydroxyphosphoribosylaminopyrimidine deaminase/5-amino-6-(5-phosphoribosylamino)uracil reductase